MQAWDFLRCRVSEYCWDVNCCKLSQPKASPTSRMGTSYRICKSNHTLFIFFFFKKLFILFLALVTRSADAWLQYLEESKRIKVSISITNVQQTVKMRSMLLNLYTVKNTASYLHFMKSNNRYRYFFFFSHHRWGIKGCYTGVKARSWIFVIVFFFTSCSSWCLMERNNVCPHQYTLEVKFWE